MNNTTKTPTVAEQLKSIVPGKTYPAYVKVEEKGMPLLEFHLNSFYVGMYCAIHVNGNVAAQNGDHNNALMVRKLKKDIAKAIERGAKIEISDIRPCKLTMD